MPSIKINDTEIYYEFIKKSDSFPTIVFLNGVMASIRSWDLYINFFSDIGYNILLHDFRGQLNSSKPNQDISFDDHADDLTALLNELEINKPILIGTSYGGEVALYYSAIHPEEIDKIVVIDSVSELDSLLKTAVESWSAAADTRNGSLFYRLALPWLYSSEFINKNMEMLIEREKKMADLPLDYMEGQISLYNAFLKLDITDMLSSIVCPALIICGEKDILKPPSFSKIIADRIKTSEYFIIPDCGHVAIFEKPEQLKTIISGFLGKFNNYNQRD